MYNFSARAITWAPMIDQVYTIPKHHLSNISKMSIFFTVHLDSEWHPSSDRKPCISEWSRKVEIILAAVSHDVACPASCLPPDCGAWEALGIAGSTSGGWSALAAWSLRGLSCLMITEFGGEKLSPTGSILCFGSCTPELNGAITEGRGGGSSLVFDFKYSPTLFSVKP